MNFALVIIAMFSPSLVKAIEKKRTIKEKDRRSVEERERLITAAKEKRERKAAKRRALSGGAA